MWINFESGRAKPVERFPVGVGFLLAVEEELIAKTVEFPPGDYLRVERLHRSPRRVARIRKERESLLGSILIDANEDIGRQKGFASDFHFAPYFYFMRGLCFILYYFVVPSYCRCRLVFDYGKGKRANRSDILSDVFAEHAVSSRDPLRQQSVFVNRRYTQAVDLQLGDIIHVADAGALEHSLMPLAEIFVRVSIIQREHLPAVLISEKFIRGTARYSLSRRIRSDQVGVFCFELREAFQ